MANAPLSVARRLKRSARRGARLSAQWKLFQRAGDCMVWTGYTNKDGRGFMRAPDGRQTTIARAMWEFYHGRKPRPGTFIAQTCGNPCCGARLHLEERAWPAHALPPNSRPQTPAIQRLNKHTGPDPATGFVVWLSPCRTGYPSIRGDDGRTENARRLLPWEPPLEEWEDVAADCGGMHDGRPCMDMRPGHLRRAPHAKRTARPNGATPC